MLIWLYILFGRSFLISVIPTQWQIPFAVILMAGSAWYAACALHYRPFSALAAWFADWRFVVTFLIFGFGFILIVAIYTIIFIRGPERWPAVLPSPFYVLIGSYSALWGWWFYHRSHSQKRDDPNSDSPNSSS